MSPTVCLPANVGMHPGASAKMPADSLSDNNDSGVKHTDASGGIPTLVQSNKQRLPQRKNLRAEFHNYSGGEYFITICTKDKAHFFGKITAGQMHYSKVGAYAYEALNTLHTHYTYVDVPLFVIMPNHVHALIVIQNKADAPGCIPTIRTALGVVIGGYKQSVTRFARRNNINFGWQSRYHDHIIRGMKDKVKIANYIENNILNWDLDCFNQ